MLIHIHRDGEQFGPYTLEDLNTYLQQGSLLTTDQAWWEGGPGWVPMEQVPGVILPGGNPPISQVAPSGRRKGMIIAAAVVGVAVVAFAGVKILGGSEKPSEPASSATGEDSGTNIGGPGAAKGSAAFAKVEPILRKYSCFDCHHSKESGKEAKADLDFAFPATTKTFLIPNQPGNPSTTRLILAITPGAGRPMPPNGPMISDAEVEVIKEWIAGGAKF